MEYVHGRQDGQQAREGVPGNFSGYTLEEHWHGAAPDAFMNHTAVSLGVTVWLEEVSAADYETAFK